MDSWVSRWPTFFMHAYTSGCLSGRAPKLKFNPKFGTWKVSPVLQVRTPPRLTFPDFSVLQNGFYSLVFVSCWNVLTTVLLLSYFHFTKEFFLHQQNIPWNENRKNIYYIFLTREIAKRLFLPIRDLHLLFISKGVDLKCNYRSRVSLI